MGWTVEVVYYICGSSWSGHQPGTIHSPTLYHIWCNGWYNQSMEPGDPGPSGKVHNDITYEIVA